MIPILYQSSETVFTSNGLGRLSDCISCIVTEERNGIYECELQYPVTGIHFEDIELGRIIACRHDDTIDIQPFDIYKVTEPINGVITVYARHISYRLCGIVVKPFTAGSCIAAVAAISSNSIGTNPFTFWTDKSVTKDYELAVPKSVRSVLGGEENSLLDAFGTAEYEFDKFTVKMHTARGTATDAEIRYGKNLMDLTNEEDGGDAYNRVVPFWKGMKSEDEEVATSEEVLVTLPEWVVDSGESMYDGRDHTVALDMSETFESEPTEAQLRTAATARMTNNEPWEIDQNITVNFVQLWQTEEYANFAPLQRVRLCDTLKIIYPQYGINHTAKVIKVVYNVLLERYDSMELGKPKRTYAQTLADAVSDRISQALANTPTNSRLDEAIRHATQLITGGLGGHVVFMYDSDNQPTEILIMDTADVSTAVNVLRINLSGIGFSSTGVNGTYTTAWTLDGAFVADFITTGNLDASLLTTGLIQDANSTNWWNLDTGELHIGGFVRSSTWFTGTAMTYTDSSEHIYSNSGIAEAVVDDMYLNTSTGNVYACTVAGDANTAKWLYKACIDGTDGRGIQSISLYSTSGVTKTYRITYTDGNHFDFSVDDGTDVTSQYLTWDNTDGLTVGYSGHINSKVNLKGDGICLYNGNGVWTVKLLNTGVQFNDALEFKIGNSNTFVKWEKQQDNSFKLKIQADEVEIGGVPALTENDAITIVSVEYGYQLSSSGTTPPTGTWSTTPVASTKTQFAWTRTTVTYSDNTVSVSYSVAGKAGQDGQDGDDGQDGTSVTITSTSVKYNSSSSGTTPPSDSDSGWGSSVPSVSQGDYLWTRTIVTYSDGTSTKSYSAARQGVNGTDVTSQYINWSSSGGLTLGYNGYIASKLNLKGDGVHLYNGSGNEGAYLSSSGLTIYDGTSNKKDMAFFGGATARVGLSSARTVDVEMIGGDSISGGVFLYHNGNQIGGLMAGQTPSSSTTMDTIVLVAGGLNYCTPEIRLNSSKLTVAMEREGPYSNTYRAKMEITPGSSGTTELGKIAFQSDNFNLTTAGKLTLADDLDVYDIDAVSVVASNSMTSPAFYTNVSSLSLGSYIAAGILTSSGSDLVFSIPTGRMINKTLSRIVMGVTARCGDSSGMGRYILTGPTSNNIRTEVTIDTSVSSTTIYNGDNVAKSLNKNKITAQLEGKTNIIVKMNTGENYFFSGSQATNALVNNQPVTLWLTGITAYFS